MPDTDLDPTEQTFDNADEQFWEGMAEKFEKEDDTATALAERDREAAAGEEDDEEDTERVGKSGTESDDDDEEHTETDTSTDASDGKPAESEEDSTEDDEDDHTEDDESTESTEAVDDDEEKDPEEDEKEAEISEAFRQAMTVTLDDVPEGPARKLVEQKLRSMDSAFTRTMQQAREYRQREVASRAEEKFREENPEIVVVELLRAHPELFDTINDRLEKLTDPDQAEAFKIVVDKKRQDAADKITASIRESEQLVERATQVESLARRLAAKANLPWEFAESAVERELLRRHARDKGKAPDVTDEEVATIVKDEALNYNRHVRAHRRAESKKTIQSRATNRTAAPVARSPAAASSPKPAGTKPRKINYDNEEERQGAMMETARRLFKGARDE